MNEKRSRAEGFFHRFPTKFVIFAANSTSSDHEIFRTLPQAAPRSDALHGRLPPPAPYVTVEGTVLGTTFRVKARTTLPAGELYAEIMALDAELKRSMSIFDSCSLLSRINRGRSDSLDSHLIYNILAADSVSRLSGGMYDITVKPARRGVGIRRQAGDRSAEPRLDPAAGRLPQDPYRRRPPRQGGSAHPARLQLDRQRLHGRPDRPHARKPRRGGLSGHHRRRGRCRGRNERGGKWRIGIETPYDNNFSDRDLQRIVEVTDLSYATSGNYRRFYYTADGRKIAHTIDPTTGRSAVTRLLSATVFCDNAVRADALGTMFMSLGAERAVEKARELEGEGVMVYFIFATDKADGRRADESPDDYETWASPALEKLLKR